MRILVIGGTGFIGPHLIGALDRLGHEVAVFHRGKSAAELPPAVKHIIGERSDLPGYSDDFRAFAPDVVIDLILSSARQAEATMNTFAGMARRVVAVSSMDVYRACGVLHRTEPGPPDPVPLIEESPLRSRPPYNAETIQSVRTFYPWVDEDYDKVPVEAIVMSRPKLPGTILRLPMVYGPGDPAHRLFPILKRIDDGRPAILLDEAVAQWRGPRGYVENMAEAIALAAVNERAAGRVYNVAQPEAFTELEWTRKVAEAAGWGGDILVLPSALSPAHLQYPGDTRQHWVADSTRVRRELGFRERVPLEETLRRTIAWERAHPPAQVDPRKFDYEAEDAALARLRGGARLGRPS